MKMKKGSASAKAWGRKMAKLRNKTLTKSWKPTMARRRKSTKKAYSRSSPKFNATGALMGGVIYGAARQKVSQIIAPFTAKIPGGVYADNVALGLLSYVVAKKARSLPMGKYLVEAGKAGLYAESVLAGSDFGANFFKSSNVKTNSYF